MKIKRQNNNIKSLFTKRFRTYIYIYIYIYIFKQFIMGEYFNVITL